MLLRDQIPALVDAWDAHADYLSHNAALLDIYEGNLLPYIEADLARDFKTETLQQVVSRIPPINVLRRIIDKLSKIYQQQPARSVISGSEADNDVFRWYEQGMKVNRVLNQANEYFNLFKSTLIQPYLAKDGTPRLRAVPSDRFVVLSDDAEDPTRPTAVILSAGSYTTQAGEKVRLFYGWSDQECIIFNSKKELEAGRMAQLGNPDGLNVYGRLPFVYVNRSPNSVIPKIDTDTLSMTKLIPVLLADLAYAVKFQSFSVIYGVDVDDESLIMAPNAFWRFKSDPNSEKKPEIGTIKPQVDITEVLGFISSTLSFWLQSRNIRPGAVGELTAENFSSGISKMVDEMDTSDDRQKQVEFFRPAEEEELWDLVMHAMHPVWVATGAITNQGLFSPEAAVEVNFAEQLPMVRRGQLVADLKVEVDAGFTTRKAAVSKLNPQWTEEEVEAHLKEIEEEKAQRAADAREAMGEMGQPQDPFEKAENGEADASGGEAA